MRFRVSLLVVLAMVAVRWVIAADEKPTAGNEWQSLFDGKKLGKWKPSEFSPNGKIDVKDGQLHIGIGEPMSGVTWDGEPPARMNYEIELEAMRTAGSDFFCGLTFPVGKDPCSLICGGWGGTLVGLSSIDGYDASENQTGQVVEFKDKHWYKIRVKVTKEKIEAWIDAKQVIDFEIGEHKIGIRMEVEPAVPLGVSTWYTGSALRNIRLRKLD
jgi:hypothetical protein